MEFLYVFPLFIFLDLISPSMDFLLGHPLRMYYLGPCRFELVMRLFGPEDRATCSSNSLTYECRKAADKQDFTISVAAIHHLSTPIRRRQAVQVSLGFQIVIFHPPICMSHMWGTASRLETNERGEKG